MANIEIGAKISVDSGNAAQSINDLQNNLKDAKTALNNAAIGSKEYEEAQKRVKTATDNLNQAQTNGTTAFTNLKKTLGDIVPGFKSAESGATSFGRQLLALAANPIVLIIAAIVAGLKLLYDAFASTDEGAQKIKSVFDGLKAVMQELYQRAIGLGKAIYDLFTGDFKGAMEEGKKAVTGFGDAMVDAFNRGADASNLLDEVADSMRVLSLQHEAMNAKLAKSKELMTDENASYRDKKKALQESGTEIENYYKKYADLQDKNVTAIAKKYNIEKEVERLRKAGIEDGAKAFDDSLQSLTIGEKGIEDINNAIKESIQAQSEYAAKQRQQNRLEKSLNKQHNAEVVADNKEAAAKKKEIKDNELAYQKKVLGIQEQIELDSIADTNQKARLQNEIELKRKLRDAQDEFNNKKISLIELNQLKELYHTQWIQKEAELDADTNQKTRLQNKIELERKLRDAEDEFNNKKISLIEFNQLKELYRTQWKQKEAELDADTNQKARLQNEIELERKLRYAKQEFDNKKISLSELNNLNELYRTKWKQKEAELDAKEKEEKKKKEEEDKKEEEKKKKEEFQLKLQKLQQTFNDNTKSLEDRKAALDAEQSLIQQAFDDKLISELQYNQQTADLAKARTDIAKIENEQKKALMNESINALSAVANAVGKQTAFGKGVSVASALISTYEGIAKGVKLGYPLAIPAVIAASATGFAAVKNILKTPVPGGGGGNTPAGSMNSPLSTSSPLVPRSALNTTSLDGRSLASLNATASRSYVLESDIANNQQRITRITRAARIA